jgi:hypothetical protein
MQFLNHYLIPPAVAITTGKLQSINGIIDTFHIKAAQQGGTRQKGRTPKKAAKQQKSSVRGQNSETPR